MIQKGLNRATQSMNKVMVKALSYYLINENIPIDVARNRFARINSFATIPTGIQIEQSELAGVPFELILPDGFKGERSLLYIHGGAFCLGSPKTHRELTGWLAKTLRVKVIVPQYRLAPEHPYPAGLDDCFAVYRALVDGGMDPSQCLVGGDSAGGNLALVLLQRIKTAQLAMPLAGILYSPWVDLRCVSETYYTKRHLDPLMTGSWLRRMRERYRGGVDVNHPELSPVHGDLAGLPPILIHVGSNEVLLNDALLLEQHLRANQGQVHIKVWDELWHVFHAHVQYLEIARQALFETRDFINRYF